MWTYGHAGNGQARAICALECPVREFCLREALQQGNEVAIMRGGIMFTAKRKTRCVYCYFPVANKTQVCAVCTYYDPCMGNCGRMVRFNDDELYCHVCKPFYDLEPSDLVEEVAPLKSFITKDDACQATLTPSDSRSTKPLGRKSLLQVVASR